MPYSVEEETYPDGVTYRKVIVMDMAGSIDKEYDIHVDMSSNDDAIGLLQQSPKDNKINLIILDKSMIMELAESFTKGPGFYNLVWEKSDE